MKPWQKRTLWTVAGLAVAIQLVPYGRAHENPPVTGEPPWDSSATRALAVRACFDCHSNETRWPWYSHIAPMSWLMQHDVDEGRGELNFSQWDDPRSRRHSDDAAEEFEDGAMPPRAYLLGHADARLDDGERAALLAGLRATLGGDRGRGRRGRDR